MNWIKKDIVSGIIISIITIISLLIFFEIFIRLFPPKGVYLTLHYDDDIGHTYKPYSKIIYNKVRYVESFVNQDGFLDIEHVQLVDSLKDNLKVAFFGDSYVESMQVPLEKRFFRLLPDTIANHKMYYYAFGLSGSGVLHSYLTYLKFKEKYKTDLVIYVFVENDLGDNIPEIARSDRRPMAKLIDNTSDKFEIDYSYKKYNRPLFNFLRTLSQKSMLVDFIKKRIFLLRQKGIQIQVDDKAKTMQTIAQGQMPDQNDVPSSWPHEIRDYAQRLGFAILQKWSDEVKKDKIKFVVFYVPRSEKPSNDTWKQWLIDSCDRLDIPVIDPTDVFYKEFQKGIKIYDDHWSPQGHIIVAKIIENWLNEFISQKAN